MMKKTYNNAGGNKEGYQTNGGRVELTQGSLGAGMGKACYSKAPSYNTLGDVQKMVHGHIEVGEKI